MRKKLYILLFSLIGISLMTCSSCGPSIIERSDERFGQIVDESVSGILDDEKSKEQQSTPTEQPTSTPETNPNSEPHSAPPDLSIYGKITLKRWYYYPVEGGCQNTYLVPGDHVVVSFDALDYDIRSSPYLDDDNIVGYAHPGDAGRITDGPKCDSHQIIWQVMFRDNTSGWFAEGDEINRGLLPLDNYKKVIDIFYGDFEKMHVYDMLITTLFSSNMPDSDKEHILINLRKDSKSNTFNKAVSMLPIYNRDHEYEPTTFDDLLGGAMSSPSMIPNDSDFKHSYPVILINLANNDTQGDELMRLLGWDK